MYAIFYKEWIKTRWYFLLAVVTTLGFTGYCMLRINRVIEMKGAAHVWEVMMQRDAIFIDMLQYIPLIAGVLMAIVQFVPEMQRKCLKLTLHLPYPELKMTGNMLFSGLVLLLVCFASNFLLMEVYLSGVLAHELKNHILPSRGILPVFPATCSSHGSASNRHGNAESSISLSPYCYCESSSCRPRRKLITNSSRICWSIRC